MLDGVSGAFVLQFTEKVIQTRMADPVKHGLTASKITHGALVTELYQLKKKTEVCPSDVNNDELTQVL